MEDSAKEAVLDSVQTIAEEIGLEDVTAVAMEDSAKDTILSSIQAIADHVGVGDIVSSVVDGFADNESEEDEPKEIELWTGATFVTIKEIDEDKNDEKNCCCCCCKCTLKEFLIVMSGSFIGPVNAVFVMILTYSINSIETWMKLLAVPYPQGLCEDFPLPKCQDIYANIPTIPTTTPFNWFDYPADFPANVPTISTTTQLNWFEYPVDFPSASSTAMVTTTIAPDPFAGLPSFQGVSDTYNNVFNLFGIISGMAIVQFNYRVTAIVGACISGVACLVAGYIPQEPRLLSFVLGALPGIGNNLLYTSLMVALLEHFRERSASVMSTVVFFESLSAIVFYICENMLFPLMGISIYNWQPLLLYQAATYALCVVFAMALIPLNLHMKDDPKEKARSRILGINGFEILKSPTLYCLCAIFLFDGIGTDVPKSYIEQASGTFLLSKLLTLFISCGESIGASISCILSVKKLSLFVSLILITVCEFLMGALSFAVEAFDVDEFAIAYSATIGLLAGFRKPLLDLTVMLALGDQYLGLSVGLTSFARGVGSIVGAESAGAIIEDYGRVDAVFYLAALSFLGSSASCLLLIRNNAKVNAVCTISEKAEEEEGARNGKEEKDEGEAESNLGSQIFTVETAVGIENNNC